MVLLFIIDLDGKGRKKLKKKYSNDYEPYYEDDEKGSVIEKLKYKGNYYSLDFDTQEYRKRKNLFRILSTVILILYLIMGMISHPGDRAFYIVYPYLFPIIPLYYLLQSVYSLPKETMHMEYVRYDTSFLRIRRTLVGIEINMTFLIFLDIFYIVRNFSELKREALITEVIFLLLTIFIFLIIIVFLKMHIRLIKNIKINKYTA